MGESGTIKVLENCIERMERSAEKAGERIRELEAENARLQKAIENAPCPVVVWRNNCQKDTECEPDCWKRAALEGRNDD